MPDPAERHRQKAEDCRRRSLQASNPIDKVSWLWIAEEWQKLAEELDVAEARFLPWGLRMSIERD